MGRISHQHSSSDNTHSWGYDDHNGPHTWGKHCRHGTRQSPIDIRTSNLEFAYINQLHFVNYDQSGAVELKNNGHGVAISGFEKWEPRQRPYIYGGGLTGKYLLLQFHFHWTHDHLYGSEHSINNLHYPVEVHLVHVKEEYTLTEALEQPDGLAVVGIFMYIGSDGSSMANLESGLKRVVEQDSATLIFNYTVGVHLPPVLDNFYRYQGSLTTPGCDESVIWTLMAEPIPILTQQLETLRAIHGPVFGKRLSVNVRPLQPLNGRRVQFRSSSLNRQKICSNDTSAMKPSGNGVVAVFIGPVAFCFAFFVLFLNFNLNNHYIYPVI
uniref:Carbonic anhydrase n=1 Tax=Meloidogyne hapla TaxID=6305 RepID=A0A1I8B487_MELHA